MTPEALFSFASTTALLAWAVLILFQRTRRAADVVTTVAVVLFASAYVVILGTQWPGSEGGFGSLEAVAMLFSNRWLLLAGWIHYLAFDLLVGRWEAHDGGRLGISPWLLAPILFLTFMFGPAGWLLYMVLRTVLRDRPAAVVGLSRGAQ